MLVQGSKPTQPARSSGNRSRSFFMSLWWLVTRGHLLGLFRIKYSWCWKSFGLFHALLPKKTRYKTAPLPDMSATLLRVKTVGDDRVCTVSIPLKPICPPVLWLPQPLTSTDRTSSKNIFTISSEKPGAGTKTAAHRNDLPTVVKGEGHASSIRSSIKGDHSPFQPNNGIRLDWHAKHLSR